jgi:hypothetical protein
LTESVGLSPPIRSGLARLPQGLLRALSLLVHCQVLYGRYFRSQRHAGQIGVELEWAESEADFRAARLKTARLFLTPDAAEEFAADQMSASPFGPIVSGKNEGENGDRA